MIPVYSIAQHLYIPYSCTYYPPPSVKIEQLTQVLLRESFYVSDLQ